MSMRFSVLFVAGACALLGLAGCGQARQEVAVAASSAAMPVAQTGAAQSGTVWIDVRTAEEYAQGHLPGAINIPHEQIGSRIASVVADKQAPVYLYCRSGRRSGIALETVQQLGYRNVVNKGSYTELAQQCQSRQLVGIC